MSTYIFIHKKINHNFPYYHPHNCGELFFFIAYKIFLYEVLKLPMNRWHKTSKLLSEAEAEFLNRMKIGVN